MDIEGNNARASSANILWIGRILERINADVTHLQVVVETKRT